MADTALTINSARVSPLSVDEIANAGFSVKYNVLYSDIAYGTGSTDTVTLTLGATPTGYYIDKALGVVTTAFAGTTALTAQVGTTSSTAALISAQSILSAGALEMVSTVPILTNATATTSVSLVAIFTNATGGSPSALTAGEMNVYLHTVALADLP